MYRRKSLNNVLAAAAAAFALAASAFAQEGGWGSDVEDFSTPQRPARMSAEAGSGVDFGAALEAAAAAEGRGTAEPAKKESAAKSESASEKEFVPKNEITVTKNPGKADSAAAPKAEKKKKEKKPKAEGSGEKLGHYMGARFGVGHEIDLSLGFGIGLSDVNRLGIGINAGWGTDNSRGFVAYEGFGFYDWCVNISDDGALSWFVGPGLAFGWYGVDKDKKVIVERDSVGVKPGTTSDSVYYRIREITSEKDTNKELANSFGLGGRIGLEVDLSFIDPDHALKALRSTTICMDARPMLYLFNVKDGVLAEYPKVVITMGISFNYVFGGGKAKEKK